MLGFPVPVPKNGDDFDATPVAEDLAYLLQVLQAYDLSNVLPGSALDSLFAPSNSPLQRFTDAFQSFVVSGGLSSGFTLLSYTVPAVIGATFQSNGIRVATIGGQTFTAAINSDTYISINSSGAINSPSVAANNAPPPALPTADSQWLQKVVSNGTTITSIVDIRNLSPCLGGTSRMMTRSASMTGFSAETDSAMPLTIYAPGNRNVEITADFPQIFSSVTGDRAHVRVKRDGTEIGGAYIGCVTNGWAGRIAVVDPAPTAGLHVYTFSVQRDIGTGTLTVFSSAPVLLTFMARVT